MLKLEVLRKGTTNYGNPIYNLVYWNGTQDEWDLAFEMGILRNYRNGFQLKRNTKYNHMVGNAPFTVTKGKRKIKTLEIQLVHYND